MNYDSTSLPERYHSCRALSSADVSRWVSLVQGFLPQTATGLSIDLGCGTGRFTLPIAERLGISVLGIDPALKMLREAVRNSHSSRIAYCQARAESIPLDAHSVALIFMSNAIHHLGSIEEALAEMLRVLQSDGITFIRNYSLENLKSLHYLRFFPEAMQVSREMIWPRRRLVETFTATKFAMLAQGTLQQEASPNYEAYIRKIGSRVYSDLTFILDEAFHRGIARMTEACASLPDGDGPIIEEVDYFVFQKC